MSPEGLSNQNQDLDISGLPDDWDPRLNKVTSVFNEFAAQNGFYLFSEKPGWSSAGPLEWTMWQKDETMDDCRRYINVQLGDGVQSTDMEDLMGRITYGAWAQDDSRHSGERVALEFAVRKDWITAEGGEERFRAELKKALESALKLDRASLTQPHLFRRRANQILKENE